MIVYIVTLLLITYVALLLMHPTWSMSPMSLKIGRSEKSITTIQSCLELLRVPDEHVSILNDLPNYVAIPGQRGFNMSMTKIENKYVFSVRYFNTLKALMTGKIKPGNKQDNRFPHRKVGENFVWGMRSKGISDCPVIFEADFDPHTCKISNIGRVQYDYNIRAFSEKDACACNHIMDIRVCNINGELYIYDGAVLFIKKLNLSKAIMEKDGYYNTSVCGSQQRGYVKKYDKNWAIWKVDDEKFVFFHWFEKDGVYIVNVPKNNMRPCIKTKFVQFKRNSIPPLGDPVLPMFSFTTPFISTKYGDISVGHTKIILSYNYNKDGKIYKFIKDVREHFPSKGEYIEHGSYIYLAYFILVRDNSFYFSNSFLPVVPVDSYIFSIIFPMGIIECDDKLIVSAGIGDWANIIMRFDTAKVAASCIHDAENFNNQDYDYEMINL